ncbi:MAG TPA: NADH-quinone oxidoreductase subunit NuoK, partial [Verrucomicrobiales bacterium]|nr:NADH-quinone oxidoreductase subunit NuoK [Verrucomicrobiales bacterium]
MIMDSLTPYLLLSAGLFCTGLMGVLLRRNIIIMLAGVELMLNAANINFVAFWRFHPSSEEVSGLAMVVFAMAIAAAEAAVGLALAISIYRHYRSTN